MAAPIILPFHEAAARYVWNDQFFMCPLAEDAESDFAFEELRTFMREQRGRKVGLNLLVCDGAKPPTAEQRARSRAQMVAVESGISHTATVILGAGFFASLFLGIAGTMMRMRPTETPRVLTQNLPEFSQFIAQHSRANVSPFEVLSATNWMLHDVAGRRVAPSSSNLRATG